MAILGEDIVACAVVVSWVAGVDVGGGCDGVVAEVAEGFLFSAEVLDSSKLDFWRLLGKHMQRRWRCLTREE